MAGATAQEVEQLRQDLIRVSAELTDHRQRTAQAVQQVQGQQGGQQQASQVDREKDMRQLLDSKILTKIDTYKGGDTEWLDWKFTMLTACGLVGLESPMIPRRWGRQRHTA